MIKTEVNVNNQNEMNEVERKLRLTGYTLISNCFWTKIYRKNEMEIVITRA